MIWEITPFKLSAYLSRLDGSLLQLTYYRSICFSKVYALSLLVDLVLISPFSGVMIIKVTLMMKMTMTTMMYLPHG